MNLTQYLKYRTKWHLLPRLRVVSKYPTHLDIESTNACNLSCTMCMRGAMTDKVGMMDWKTFKSVFLDAHPVSVKLNWRGEPLLHPDIIDFIYYAKTKCNEVSINTNGILLTSSMANELANAELDWLIISVDGATKHTYEKIRQGAKFETLMTNIETLNKEYSKRLVKTKVRIQICKQPDNEDELSLWRNTFQFLADSLRVGNRFNPQGKKNYRAVQPQSCPQLWQRLTVSWKGNIYPCPSDFLCKFHLGNVNFTTIKDAWHDIIMDDLRNILKKHGRSASPLCKNCSSYC